MTGNSLKGCWWPKVWKQPHDWETNYPQQQSGIKVAGQKKGTISGGYQAIGQICQRPTSQQAMKGMERFKVQLQKKRKPSEGCHPPACWDAVSCSSRCLTWHPLTFHDHMGETSLTALILKDYPGQAHYTERRLAPSSLLLHWITLASSSVISLEHHLCMLCLGYYLQESKYYS